MEPRQYPTGLSSLMQMVALTLRDPKAAARAIMGLNLSMPVLWQILAIVVCVSVFLGQASLLLVSEPGQPSLPFVGSPLVLAGFQFVLIAAIVYLIHYIGRGMGGRGQLDGSLALMTWLQVMMAVLQVVQSILMLFMPAMAVFIGYLGLAMFLWLLTNFVAVLHGFKSLGIVFVMILVSAFGVTFVLSILMSILGIVPPGVVNV